MNANKPPKPGDNEWAKKWGVLLLIVLALIVWCSVHAIGAYRAEEDPAKAVLKSLIIFGCLAGFLGFWGMALLMRRRRLAVLAQAAADEKE